MKKHTQFEKDFTQKVREFCKTNDMSMSQLGNHPEIGYSNLTKLTEFFIEQKGSLTSGVMGRIETFINKHSK